MVDILHPRVIEDPTHLLIHAIIDRPVAIGRHKLLWDVSYPLGKIDLTGDVSHALTVSLSTVRYVPAGSQELYGEHIVSTFVFSGMSALLFGRKNIHGILAYPILQIESGGAILLSTRVSHAKFQRAFSDITASILQQYTHGGAMIQSSHLDADTHAATQNLWETSKHAKM